MTLRLNGSTSGYVEIDAPATAGSNTLVLPTGNGTNGQYLQTNGSGSLSWATVTDTNGLTHLTTVSTSSVSTVTVTGIPSTATMVYVNIDNFGDTVNNSSRLQMRVGNGSVDTGSNYSWNCTYLDGSGGNGMERSDSSTTWRILHGGISGTGHRNKGTIQLLRTNDRGWIMTALLGDDSASGYMQFAAGRYHQNTAIDRVQLYNAASDNITDGSLIMVSYQ